MPFNPFVTTQPQQQQQGMGGINPLQGFQAYSQFSGQGGLGSLFGGGAGGTGGTAAGSSAGGGSSALASAGPWAALAALIVANESGAREGGYRDEDTGEYLQDLFGGKVLEQDFNQRFLPKLVGEDFEDDKLGLGADASVAADLSTFDFSNAWDTFKDHGLLSKLF